MATCLATLASSTKSTLLNLDSIGRAFEEITNKTARKTTDVEDDNMVGPRAAANNVEGLQRNE